MEDIRPTAKWANRMLRPLTSIYHRLEKHHEIVSSVLISKAKEREKSDTTVDVGRTRLSTKGVVGQGCSYSDDEEPNDPAWIPGKLDKRRIRHNYASRGRGNGGRRRSRLLIRSPEIPKTLPGAIEIATPLITGKIRGSLADSSLSLRTNPFQSHLSMMEKRASSEHRKQGRIHNSSFAPYQGSWKEVLDQSGDPGLVDIAHLLDRVFLKFLKNTRIPPSGPKGVDLPNDRGARSLLSMSVRCLPEFMAGEQRLQDESEEGCDVDMCDAYFAELEASYAPNGLGWQPLREAARAQGIYLVSRMIQNKWINPPAACRLLEESLAQEEFDAFESLMTTCLTNVGTYHYPVAFDPPRPSSHQDDPVHILGTYYQRSPVRRAYVLEELSKLLMRGAFPPEWMVTTLWKRCVDGAIKSVSTVGRDYMSGRQIIEAVILSSTGVYLTLGSKVPPFKASCSQPLRAALRRGTQAYVAHASDLRKGQPSCPIPIQDALSNLVASLITALCGICIARSQAAESQERLAGLKTREIIHYLAYTVQRDLGNGSVSPGLEGLTFEPLRRGYVLLADYTLQCGMTVRAEAIYIAESVSRRNIESFLRSLASRQDVVKELAMLVSQVFYYYGHAHGKGLLRTPKEIRARVSQLAQLTSGSGVALLLGKVAAEAAMELAEKSLDPDDHTWAVEIQEAAAASQPDKGSQQSSSPRRPYSSLYRWEDSIGEWVARTPAAKPPAVPPTVALKQRAGRRGRPRIIACSVSSSPSSSTCSENSISSVTSSTPSVSKKRLSANHDPSRRPFKKTYHTRWAEQVGSQASDWADIPHRPVFKPLIEATQAPVASRTGTRMKDELQTGTMDHGNATARNPSGGPFSRIEVVIVNKSSLQPARAAPTDSARLLRRRSPGKSYRLARRRQSAPAPMTRRKSMIPCSQEEDSDDELSFL
ncbi:uncharacterized protein BJX67DRAFT_380065 [Aspergillus lucknowensis]|uniref:Uncharacterized protein n=1 Tax=Aspergillus lucknowensis TaxID=176173 RepID=A0ABR4LV25_9EURO